MGVTKYAVRSTNGLTKYPLRNFCFANSPVSRPLLAPTLGSLSSVLHASAARRFITVS